MQASLNCSFIPFLPWEKKLQNLREKKVVIEEKISPHPLFYSLNYCKSVLGEINASDSFYTRELWFCHLAEFRTNSLSFDMFDLISAKLLC